MVPLSEIWGVAWSIFWKTILAGIVLGMVINGVLSLFLPALLFSTGMEEQTVFNVVVYVAYAISFVAYFLVFSIVLANSLGRDVRGKRLELVEAIARQEA
ncbi:hypothetical protein PV773_05615 [Mesorhizobium sp. CC13]|uniref:hypothetical protein n=1 Tax=Mesorhizobium sp. CC13 TaxID=3029194 RepID=UPI003264FB0B